ncbi:tRNA (cytidine(34)-2'-O)-methyltransferase [Desulfosporosinus sp. Sb-LF]|nr:tRNA (cytidine(34)-2'-O)-methyltransferase [Desulfosporosinus sp. Sb-LF]
MWARGAYETNLWVCKFGYLRRDRKRKLFTRVSWKLYGVSLKGESVLNKRLNIVLVEPEIPPNTGNVARLCAVTGASLHLVKPLGFSIDDKQLKRAGLDYWNLLDITIYENFAEFEEKNPVGTRYLATTKGGRTHTDIVYEPGGYLLFGKETKGLAPEILTRYPDTTLRLPMRAEARSLNLSNSVAVVVYEVLRQWGFQGLE